MSLCIRKCWKKLDHLQATREAWAKPARAYRCVGVASKRPRAARPSPT